MSRIPMRGATRRGRSLAAPLTRLGAGSFCRSWTVVVERVDRARGLSGKQAGQADGRLALRDAL